MNLQRIGPRTVAGAPDFEVQEAFPDYLEYREAGRVLRVSAEMASYWSGASILLYDDDGVRMWQPPHRNEALGPARQRQILVRITAALKILGIRAAWEAIPPFAEREDWPVIRAEAEALLK